MKKQILLAVMIAFLSVVAASDAAAQSTKSVKVKIGFDFEVKGRSFPAGEYYIEKINCCTSGSIVAIRGAGKNKNQIIIPADEIYAAKVQAPKIVFARRADKHFLTEVFFENGRWGISLKNSDKEKNLASASRTKIVVPLSK